MIAAAENPVNRALLVSPSVVLLLLSTPSISKILNLGVDVICPNSLF